VVLAAAIIKTRMETRKKILQIGNYPPPMCGWAMQLKLVTEELRRRGHVCEILKINEGREIKSPEYVDVQGGLDYLIKIWKFALRGYRLNVHVNGMSKKGYALALAAGITGRLVGQPALVTFHGGLSQDFFPKHDGSVAHWAFYLLFALAGRIACDSQPIHDEIIKYGISSDKVRSIATFSPQYLQFTPVALPDAVETFLQRHFYVFLSYVSFRAEYRLEILREGMKRFREIVPHTGYIWLGFPEKELPAAQEFVSQWPDDERNSLLLLGNLNHDQFLTLLSRCTIYLRTPACDGVAASVLEAVALRVPVVASQNGRRPSGVITYGDTDVADMVDKLSFVIQHLYDVRSNLQSESTEDNIGQMVDWLTGRATTPGDESAIPEDKTIVTGSSTWR